MNRDMNVLTTVRSIMENEIIDREDWRDTTTDDVVADNGGDGRKILVKIVYHAFINFWRIWLEDFKTLFTHSVLNVTKGNTIIAIQEELIKEVKNAEEDDDRTSDLFNIFSWWFKIILRVSSKSSYADEAGFPYFPFPEFIHVFPYCNIPGTNVCTFCCEVNDWIVGNKFTSNISTRDHIFYYQRVFRQEEIDSRNGSSSVHFVASCFFWAENFVGHIR
jgi:hypothetical protein